MSRLIFNNRATVADTPASGKSTAFVLTADGMLKIVGSDGLIKPATNVLISSTIASSGAIANTDTKIGSGLQISANELTAGDLIRFTVMGTNTTSNPGAQVFTVRYGAANTVADTAQCTVSLTSVNGSAIPFRLIIELTVRTIGVSGTIYGYASLINGDGATTGIYSKATTIQLVGAIATINTTSSGYIGLSYISGHANTASTFQNVVVELIKA